jgi:hypothetical protein
MADTRHTAGPWVSTLDASVQAVPEGTPAGKGFDLVGKIMAHESGGLDDAGIVELFQHLVDTGMAWQLQGNYGRVANALIQAGYVEPPQVKPRGGAVTEPDTWRTTSGCGKR